MSDHARWRPPFRVLAPIDPSVGSSGSALAEIRSVPTGEETAAGAASAQVLALTGELCAYSVHVLAPVLAELATAATDLKLDLSEVTFVDASALTMLIDLGQQVADRGGELVLDPISPCVDRVLVITGLDPGNLAGPRPCSRPLSAAARAKR